MRRPILVGSTYFFHSFPDFKTKDIDQVLFIDNPNFTYRQTSGPTSCLFEWKVMSPEEYIEYHLKTKLSMTVGKWLVKRVCDEVGFTLEHLEKLRPVFEKMDDRHLYEKIIFDYIIENQSWDLTKEQLEKAYTEYKNARPNKKNKL